MNAKEAKAALIKKGFQKVEGGKHMMLLYHRISYGKKTRLTTLLSRGNQSAQMSGKSIARMARQCGLTSKQFEDFVKCDIDQREFESISTKIP